jgi:hypothetical protein
MGPHNGTLTTAAPLAPAADSRPGPGPRNTFPSWRSIGEPRALGAAKRSLPPVDKEHSPRGDSIALRDERTAAIRSTKLDVRQ